MHWVENTQYCTVHGGKAQRREVSDESAVADPRSEGNHEVSAAQHQDRKASGTISTYFKGAGGSMCDPEQESGALSVTGVKTVERNSLQRLP